MKKLTEDFLLEYFKLCFRNREIIEIGAIHLKFQYLAVESHKELWKSIKQLYQTRGELPTLGQISQLYNGNGKEDKEVLELLSKIKQVEVPTKEAVLVTFEEFIKDSMSVEFYDKFADLYNKDNRDEARIYLREVAEELTNFSITKETSDLERIFAGFKERQQRRQLEASGDGRFKIKIPFGIDELDELLGGGLDVTDTALFLAQSGVGKTKLLRWIGVSAARRGFKVLHIQLEGAKSEAEDGYDATWTAQSINALEYGNLDPAEFNKLIAIAERAVEQEGDIWVEGYEEFGSASLLDVKARIEEFEKNVGQVPDLVLIDYFELLEPGDGKKYRVSEERHRREAIANGMKNLAIVFKTRIVTATQASSVEPEKLNNPDHTLSRYDISEFKGAIKPFSLFVTLNQTKDEYLANMMRLFLDKVRKKKSKQIVRIVQAYNHDRFYDRKETIKQFYPQGGDI